MLTNDSYCSKQFYIPTLVRAKYSFLIAEKGAFNMSNSYIFIDDGPITKLSLTVSDSLNMIDFFYPSICIALENSKCRFPVSTIVNAIAQIQTFVNDIFLLVRGFNIVRVKAVFTLQTHQSFDSSYALITSAETLGYMAFQSTFKILCTEGYIFEAVLAYTTSDLQSIFLQYPVTDGSSSIFGIVKTLSGLDPVNLQYVAVNATTATVTVRLVEDLCLDEETTHTQETASVLALSMKTA